MSGDRPAKGLGKGLSALLGDARPTMAPQGAEPLPSGVRDIEVARISANPDQPRRQFDDSALAELAESIAERGVLQPVLVRPDGGGGYQIVAGERRWRAAQRAQVHAIPAIVREFDDAATAEVALIENIQREDLNAIEEAEGYHQLISRHGHTQDGVARLVHKSRSHVANLLRLRDLPDFVKQSLLRGDISMGHARAVAAAPDPEGLARIVVTRGLSVRQAEALAKNSKPDSEGRTRRRKSEGAVDADLAALEQQLGDMLGLKVQVVHKGQGGSVTLSYSTLDQLDMICQRLSGEPI
jgi:ParB family chromosome partitioning protein